MTLDEASFAHGRKPLDDPSSVPRWDAAGAVRRSGCDRAGNRSRSTLSHEFAFRSRDAGMTRRSGSADLPLHHGRVPAWLGQRMTRLGAVICEAIIHHYGREELLRRLAHPFWFQSFGAVMGMD